MDPRRYSVKYKGKWTTFNTCQNAPGAFAAHSRERLRHWQEIDAHRTVVNGCLVMELTHPFGKDHNMGILAEVHSDDRNVEVSFDASPWFKQASDEQIRDLLECDFGGDEPADEVARWTSGSNPEVVRVFDYLETIRDDQTKKDVRGFECHVNKKDALIWLRQNRPALAAEYDVYHGD